MTTHVQERRYFPAADVALHDDGVRVESYWRDDTEVRVSVLPPGARVPGRPIGQAQVAMVVQGRISTTVGEVTRLMEPERHVCVAPPGVSFSAVNPTESEAVLLELRRSKPGEIYPAPSDYFLEPFESRKFVGMDVTFFVADWIELMIADIPGGGEMPYHRHSHEQIGVCLEGRYDMTVEESSHELRFGGTYFCASQEGHGAVNPHADVARSVNIFIPPRYHRVPGQKTRRKNEQDTDRETQ
ncbi:cupin domain-containing protein [Streptomyces coeruleorubidus]|uniref:Cupin domain-containing protein n=1 Tax=Streptomyces coeruleorubidus TaxID=116188 RepID=A0A5J6I1G7_STRC4|nr:cupin domain-containing protein [Streptomyces coeruleorubidus]QEV22755.1 cupin domain-containing protein [Streptomyces coeruleorubidus]GGU02698.1 H2HPP isomerase [Streptomyces coeruleorubidus]